jgi:hypothetical protein
LEMIHPHRTAAAGTDRDSRSSGWVPVNAITAGYGERSGRVGVGPRRPARQTGRMRRELKRREPPGDPAAL